MAKSIHAAGAWKGSEGTILYLAGARKGAFPQVPSEVPMGKPLVPKSEGNPFGTPSVQDWVKKQDADIEQQMVNKVRKCGECGKPNAFTLTTCNSCGKPLPDELSYTPNLFMCFVYGFEAVGLSLRYQDERVMVFDDLLSLSPLHVNAVWAANHIPDFRYLFLNPRDGLAILKEMHTCCERVADDFFKNKDFRDYYLKEKSPEDMKRSAFAVGMNFPPSQYQLHLQYMMFPLLPFQYAQYLKGTHFTKDRFFPHSFLVEALEKACEKGVVIPLLPIESFIQEAQDKLGVDYYKVWEREYVGYGEAQKAVGRWSIKDFSFVCEGEATYQVKGDDESGATRGANVEGRQATDVVAEDKLELQNYGRPYTDGKPQARNTYRFARKPGECPTYLLK